MPDSGFLIRPIRHKIFILRHYIQKLVKVLNKSCYCFSRTIIHFAHYVRSVAVWLSRLTKAHREKPHGHLTASISANRAII